MARSFSRRCRIEKRMVGSSAASVRGVRLLLMLSPCCRVLAPKQGQLQGWASHTTEARAEAQRIGLERRGKGAQLARTQGV